jgi:hypothetical protein
MEDRDTILGSLYTLALGELPQGIHDMGDIDAVGTPGGAGFA